MIALFLALLTLGTTAPVLQEADPIVDEPILTATELQLAMRDLWTGHVFWIRSYVIAEHHNDAAAAEAADAKVVENARAIADAVIPFYGQEGADALFPLLAGHYGAVKDYMKAAYGENGQAGEAATQKLTENAREIAAFLAAANPNLPESAVLPLLVAHGGHHVQQIDAVHRGDFTNEAVVWDAMLTHINGIADALAGALAKQFPDIVSA